MKVERDLGECNITGCTPQKVIRMMNDVIGRVKGGERDRIRIVETTYDNGNPFEQNPDKILKFVVIE